MKLTYWVADHLTDHQCYSARAKTKRDVLGQIVESGSDYSAPYKVTVRYSDAFDLMFYCLGEGGGYWENGPASILLKDVS